MQVHIAFRHAAYEGSTVIGVYLDRDLAVQMAKVISAQPFRGPFIEKYDYECDHTRVDTFDVIPDKLGDRQSPIG